MFYNFDAYEFMVRLLPPMLRRPVVLAFIKAIAQPIEVLVSLFTKKKTSAELALSSNGFVNTLEKFLNDLFETDEIYITHPDERYEYITTMDTAEEPMYIATKDSELETTELPTRVIQMMFYVNVPTWILSEEGGMDTIRKWVNYYKPAGTRFNIIVYE